MALIFVMPYVYACHCIHVTVVIPPDVFLVRSVTIMI
jgi:hypothetical protein